MKLIRQRAWGSLICLMLLASCQPNAEISLNPNRLKIEVGQDGYVTLTLAELQAAGLALAQLDPDNLYLSSDETAVSYTIHNESIRFFGQAPTNRYTPTRVYVLETGKRGVLGDAGVSKDATTHFEQNLLYESRARTATNEIVWFWHKLQPNSSVQIDFNLPTRTNSSGEITISLFGLSSNPEAAPDHDVDILINDQFLTTMRWDGPNAYRKTISMPPNMLRSGNNTISFSNPTATNPVDVILLDSFDIAFTTSSPTIPTQTPVTVALMRDVSWLDALSGADFVIVTTDALKTAVSPLKTHRESEGLQVAIVTIENLYDSFSHGQATPAAIREFLQFAADNWSPSPRYVLLVGDATTDHHGYVNKPPTQHIPSFIVPVTFGGETISDAPIADLDGNGRSDIALGRWPVSSKQDVVTLVQRTITYADQTNLTNATMIIDPSEPGFAQMGERVAENGRFTHLITNQRQLPPTSWLTTYIGHGSLTQWGQTGILQQDQLPPQLPPIILQFTCLTGLFGHPAQPALSETMLLAKKGPVATIAATSLTLSHHQEPFALALIAALESTEFTRIGDAFLHAQQSLDTQNNPNLQDITSTFSLLGDPTAPIQRPTNVQKQVDNANGS
jgi:hypothetical protein